MPEWLTLLLVALAFAIITEFTAKKLEIWMSKQEQGDESPTGQFAPADPTVQVKDEQKG
jgi:hypothetical protein